MAWPSASARTKNWGTEILTDTDLEAQLDLLHTYLNAALHATTGHGHTGTTSDGPLLSLTAAVTGTLPTTNGGTGLSSYTQGDIIYSSAANTLAKLAAGTSGYFLKTGGAGANPSWALAHNYICVQDQKSQNTAGGTFTSGAWRTRTLNTEVTDTGSNCSLASNQMTLDAGTYEILAFVPAMQVDAHQARLQNITDGSTVLTGTAENMPNSSATVTKSIIQGRFTLAAQKVLEIQHQCTTTRATDGFGHAANLTTEIYTTVELRKVL
jgi:hypothetical protein